ncbi:armadillo-type protein [Schizophyllum commune]
MTVRSPSLSVVDLKKIKNTVIGNPSAKVELAQDEDFIRTLVQCLNHPPPSPDPQSSQDDIRIEVAHIIASLSYGSDRALTTLIHANALGSILLAISNFRPNEPSKLRAAFARALRALGVAIADIVGPALWGLRPDDSEIKDSAKDTLNMLFQETTLDIYAPLLVHPATATSVAYLIGMSVRNEAHRKAVVDWLPPAERAQANKSRRGWEKSTVATAASAGVASIKAAGGWVVQTVAGLLKGTRDCKLQEAALLCLAALARDNAPVAAALSRGDRESTLSTVFHLTRSKFSDVEIAASLCASFIIRASRASTHAHAHGPAAHYGHIPASTANDHAIRTVFNVVERLMALSPTDSAPIITKACYVFYYLVTDDIDLCRMAYERGFLTQAFTLFEATQAPSTVPPGCPPPELEAETESESTAALREASLIALATLALASNEIRTALADDLRVLVRLNESLASRHVGTRYGACQVVRALSRSVAATRTSLVDSGTGMRVFGLLRRGEDRRVRGAALKAVCNLLVNFSPLQKEFLKNGLLDRLMEFVKSADPPLQLGALWALKNLLHKAELEDIQTTIRTFGWDRLTELLTDEDTAVQEQAVHILKNITADAAGVDLVLHKIGERELLTALCQALGSTSDDVVLQAAGVVSNLANGTPSQQDALFSHPQLLGLLRACLGERSAALVHHHPHGHGHGERSAAVRMPALSAVLALARSSHDRRHAMIEAGLLNTLQRLCERTGGTSGRWEHVPKDERDLARSALDWLEHGDYMSEEGSYLG